MLLWKLLGTGRVFGNGWEYCTDGNRYATSVGRKTEIKWGAKNVWRAEA